MLYIIIDRCSISIRLHNRRQRRHVLTSQKCSTWYTDYNCYKQCYKSIKLTLIMAMSNCGIHERNNSTNSARTHTHTQAHATKPRQRARARAGARIFECVCAFECAWEQALCAGTTRTWQINSIINAYRNPWIVLLKAARDWNPSRSPTFWPSSTWTTRWPKVARERYACWRRLCVRVCVCVCELLVLFVLASSFVPFAG